MTRSPDYRTYSFLDRGSDERQYCSPGADLPVVSIMRSKYGTYPEYHTSLDDLSLVSARGLGGSFTILRECLAVLEANRRWVAASPCEPQLGRRALYPTLSTRETKRQVQTMMDLLAYADGAHDLVALAERIGAPAMDCAAMAAALAGHGLLVAAREDLDAHASSAGEIRGG